MLFEFQMMRVQTSAGRGKFKASIAVISNFAFYIINMGMFCGICFLDLNHCSLHDLCALLDGVVQILPEREMGYSPQDTRNRGNL